MNRSRTEQLTRVALLLVLLGLAAHGLSGRRGLDWSEISEPIGGSFWDTLIFCAFGVLFAGMVVTLVRHSRFGGLFSTPGHQDRSWRGYIALAIGLAVALPLIYLLLRSAAPPHAVFRDPGKIAPSAAPSPSHGQGTSGVGLSSAALVLVAGLLVLLVVAGLLRRRGTETDVLDEDLADETDEPAALASAVAAAEAQLDSHGDDTRAAIIAAYTVMEEQLRFVGTERRDSDTPTDFLQRAVDSAHISRGAASTLTDLFREARFSSHPMPPGAREDAARALARVADDLAHARA